MKETIINYWKGLQPRERVILSWGSLLVALILFYALIWQPWHKAISHMESSLPALRENLVWMRQQAEVLQNGGASNSGAQVRGREQSLLSVIEQTAKANAVRGAIQQMVPGQSDREVRVVLEGVNFNQWVKWVDVLFRQYGVNVTQVTAEREDDEPNTAEIRMTFERP